jgi:hypothetical protein
MIPYRLEAQDVPARGLRPGLPAARACMALGLVAVLAACGSTQQHRPTSGVAVSAQNWNRPSSYDPPGPSDDPWGPYIREAAGRFDVPERWIREVMRQESGGRVTATSRVGAMGLMQVMPGTYNELRMRYGLGDDPYHPYDSIMAGTAYVREMYELYGSPGFLAAYNGGPKRFEDYLWNGRGLPAETRNYVYRIGSRLGDSHPRRRAAPEVYAAAEIPLNIPPGPRRMDGGTMLALREQRQAVDPGIRVATLPAGPVVRMDPIPDGSTSPPVQVASLAPAAAGRGLMNSASDAYLPSTYGGVAASAEPAAGGVVRMEPIPDGSTAVAEAPPPVAAPVVASALPPPPAAPATHSQLAALSTPPAYAPPPSRAALTPPLVMAPPAPVAAPARAPVAPARPVLMAAAQAAPAPAGGVRYQFTPGAQALGAPVREAPEERRSFGLIGSAHAGTLPVALRAPAPTSPTATPASAGGGWAIQVGAFASENLARNAASQARDKGGNGGRALVVPVAQGRTTLFRARVQGLSRDGAQQACDKQRGGACMVLSPDAQ